MTALPVTAVPSTIAEPIVPDAMPLPIAKPLICLEDTRPGDGQEDSNGPA